MEETVVASSPTDTGISCWDLNSGAEHLRHRSCLSPPHGLSCVAGRFLASSQLRESNSSSGSIHYWSWNKPQVEVKSFPSEPIKPLVANSEGTYIVGGGVSGDIYLWEVATGRLLKKWHAHYRAVTCLVFFNDESLLVSGSEDGCIRVWSLLMMFDDLRREQARYLYEYSFPDHSLCITDIATGYGGFNAIIVSASEDRTCKVWSISRGKFLRNIVFPSIIDAVALDPGEHVFYAGGRDGKIYIAALNAPDVSKSTYGPHIIGSFSEHSKAITCLAFSIDGVRLISGSEDGMIRVWDTKTCNVIRIFKHAKGPINNILIIRHPGSLMNPQNASVRRNNTLLSPPLQKYVDSMDEDADTKVCIIPKVVYDRPPEDSYITFQTMNKQITELQQKGSSAAAEIEIERLKLDCKRSMQMVQQWKKMFGDLHHFCTNEILDADHAKHANGNNT